MKLCTDKVVADWLALTANRVRQLRDEGKIMEKAPGLYDLRTTVKRYVLYIRKGSKADLNDERAMLARAKREAAEMENEVRRGTLHSTEDIEKGIKKMCLNIRSRFLTLPAKLAPKLAEMNGSQAEIFDVLKQAVDEVLDELSNYDIAMAVSDDENNEEAEEPL